MMCSGLVAQAASVCFHTDELRSFKCDAKVCDSFGMSANSTDTDPV